MARPRKIVSADKLGRKIAGALPDCWWRWKAETEDEANVIIIYTTQKLKIKLQPFGYYSYPSGEEAFQYMVNENSAEHKEIFSLLKLNDSHEKKIARKKRITKAEKEAQIAQGDTKKSRRKKAV